MKKILIVDNSAWNIFNFRLPLVKKLSSQGYEVVVVSPIDEYIHYLNETGFVRHIPAKNLLPRSKTPLKDLLLLIELAIIYLREKPGLIIHFTIKPNIYGSLAARFAKIPSISVVTGLGYTFLHPKGINRLIPGFYKFAFQKILKLVTYNREDRRIFIDNQIVPAEKCVIIPGSGVNTNHFRPLPKTREENKFIFLFIGRLLYDKGLSEYVEAAQQLRHSGEQIECRIAGDLHDANPAGVSKDKLLEWIENKDVVYLGKVLDVRHIIRQADVIVLPSYREGIPRVILEAMAMGKPVITTDVAGCRETVVHGENGFVVPVKNAEALSLAMSTMMESTESELTKMGELSRKRALQFFDEKIITSRYQSILSEMESRPKHERTRTGSPALL